MFVIWGPLCSFCSGTLRRVNYLYFLGETGIDFDVLILTLASANLGDGTAPPAPPTVSTLPLRVRLWDVLLLMSI